MGKWNCEELMLNSYFFDLTTPLTFSNIQDEYPLNIYNCKFEPLVNPINAYVSSFDFDYIFQKNIVLKNIYFKMVGLEGCRISVDNNVLISLKQVVKPYIDNTPIHNVYFDYAKNIWITQLDINHNLSLDISNKLLLGIRLTDFDKSIPLNNIVNIEYIKKEKMLANYSLTLTINSTGMSFPRLFIDTTNADASYNGRPITLRAYLEVEE